ncbi:MAG: hypothetical protein MJ250_07765 [Alphaproteobacteria bacterium]|nr:hypothetical protein [Alphaproteobacteria bacterium]
MQDLEQRLQQLEKKCKNMRRALVALTGVTILTVLSGAVSPRLSAIAAEEEKVNPKDIGIPTIVEAQIFMLKDSEGNIRGIWTADDTTTSFAMMQKGKFPIISMAVDNKNASMSLTDVYKGKISLGLNNSVRSISLSDDSGTNNIYMGLTGQSEAVFDIVSPGKSAMAIDGKSATIDLTGDKTAVALAETVGSAVALQAQPSTSNLLFVDHNDKKTMEVSTIDGATKIFMSSPALKEERTLTTVEPVYVAPEKKADEEAEAEAKVEESKPVDMKSYSPFGK